MGSHAQFGIVLDSVLVVTFPLAVLSFKSTSAEISPQRSEFHCRHLLGEIRYWPIWKIAEKRKHLVHIAPADAKPFRSRRYVL